MCGAVDVWGCRAVLRLRLILQCPPPVLPPRPPNSFPPLLGSPVGLSHLAVHRELMQSGDRRPLSRPPCVPCGSVWPHAVKGHCFPCPPPTLVGCSLCRHGLLSVSVSLAGGGGVPVCVPLVPPVCPPAQSMGTVQCHQAQQPPAPWNGLPSTPTPPPQSAGFGVPAAQQCSTEQQWDPTPFFPRSALRTALT